MSTMIQQVSGIIPRTTQPSAAAFEVKGPQSLQQPGHTAPGHSSTPVTDEYVPEEKTEPIGLYRLGRDEDGKPKIYFDDPARAADKPEQSSGSDVPTPEKSTQRCICSTDQVDREIESLKKKQAELERQISAQLDEGQLRGLEQKLVQVENELAQKDNDTYRRQHAVFS